jgi:hypothetical protein
LIVNNDGTNLLWRSDLTLEMVRRHIAECPSAVTTYRLCPNGIRKMLYARVGWETEAQTPRYSARAQPAIQAEL